MAEFYNVHLNWKRETDDFDYKTYNRKHTVVFYGGPKLNISSAPDFIRNPEFQSPEELLVAAVSSCYLLTFLSIAAKKGFVVDGYVDDATCILSKVGNKQAITQVNLRPVIAFDKDHKPDMDSMTQIFEAAREHCFIANSLTATIFVNPQFADCTP